MQSKKITLFSTGRPASQPRTPFGERLHAAREVLGLSQAQVAEQLGMSQNAYACWERRTVALRPDQIERLAHILRIPIDALFNGYGGMDRKSGLAGKVRQVFERVSQLPRKQQAKVVEFVEAFVEKKAAVAQ